MIGHFIISNYHIIDTIVMTFDRFASLLEQGWVLKTLAFAILVGSVMKLIEKSGGIDALVYELSVKRELVNSKKTALIPSFIAGIIIFIESSITALVSGAIGRAFCDKYGVPRAKLAYVCDSTSAPVCSLIPINGWGALIMGLIGSQLFLIGGESASWLIASLKYNFYAIFAIIIAFISIVYNIEIGSMKNATIYPYSPTAYNQDEKKDIRLFAIPMIFMIVGVIVFMFITGGGEFTKGSGSSSVFYTLSVTVIFMWLYYRYENVMKNRDFFIHFISGAKSMVGITMILLLAFAIGGVSSDMGVGVYLSSFVGDYVAIEYIAAMIFLIASIIAFATGTSWGTFSIMIPIAIPLAAALNIPPELAIAAAISGGVFGDHCSPISDTTIISSMASGCDVIEHTKTQLPYAIIGAVAAFISFIIAGVMLV